MLRSELPPPFEENNALPKIRAFLQTETDNAHFQGERPQTGYRSDSALLLEEALNDFDNGSYTKAIKVLEKYYGVYRTRANQETDVEAMPVFDNANANEIGNWIDILTRLREAHQ